MSARSLRWPAGRRDTWRFVRYAGPALVLLGAVTLFPLLYSVRTSFYASSFAAGVSDFVGLHNYGDLLTDRALWHALRVTALIVVPALAAELLVGTCAALALDRLRRGRALLTTVLSLPVMVAGAATGMSFRLLFTPQWGPVDTVTRWLTGSTESVDWLGTTTLAPVAVVIADVWQHAPFVMLIVLAGLSAIPGEIGEAARVDGASAWQEFRYMTLPLITRVLAVAVIFRSIDLLRIFDVIYVMTGGGPARATQTVSVFGYEQGIQFFHVGYAAALGLVLALAVLGLTRSLVRVAR